MKHLYRDDLERLKRITYSGRTKDETKTKMSPKKVEALKGLFNERLKNKSNSDERMNNFGKLVKTAIENISKTSKSYKSD